MSRLTPRAFQIPKLIASLALVLALAAGVYAQGKQAIVILKPQAATQTAKCDGAADIQYQMLYELRLNNDEQLRLAGNLTPSGPLTSVSRKDYEAAIKTKLRDLVELKWNVDGVLYGVSLTGALPVLPEDMKPQKNNDQPLSSFYSVMLTAEARENKQKRKVSLPLKDVWKIYFVAEGVSPNESLFKHAVEEKSIALWEVYLKKTNSFRAADADTHMREALISCARTDLKSFAEGDYGSLQRAQQRAARAQSVRDDELTRQLLADIRRAQTTVEQAREQVQQLIRASKWDEAINAAAPIKMYLTTWPDLNAIYKEALKRSHDMHLFMGEEALRGKQLESARDNCTIAWQRLSESQPARNCVCLARNELTLRDSMTQRQQKRPKDAKSLLEAQLADRDCNQDQRVVAALRETNCEYAHQLLAESRQLITLSGGATLTTPRRPQTRTPRQGKPRATPKPETTQPVPETIRLKGVTAENKKDFREVHEKLVLANQLCPEEAVAALLAATKRSLAEYCIEQARKALQRGHPGTAYVYLQTAQAYTPENPNLASLLSQARDSLQEGTRVSVGVVLENSGRIQGGDQALNEIAATVQSVVPRSGLAQAVFIEPRQAANALRSIQANRDAGGPAIIFVSDLLGGQIRRTDDPRYVRSSYSFANPRWAEADRVHDAANADYKKCVRQSGEPNCTGLRDRVDSLRRYRDQIQRNITEYYTYRETTIRVEGGLRVAFRVSDNISHSTSAAETFDASVSLQCVQREGVNPGDYSARDTRCDIGSEQAYFSQMVQKLKNDTYAVAIAQLRSLPSNYYVRARSATNRQQGIEDYVRFLFLVEDKTKGDAQEARRILASYDPELTTDGVIR